MLLRLGPEGLVQIINTARNIDKPCKTSPKYVLEERPLKILRMSFENVFWRGLTRLVDISRYIDYLNKFFGSKT